MVVYYFRVGVDGKCGKVQINVAGWLLYYQYFVNVTYSQQAMKFKGQVLRIKNKQYSLKEQLAEGGFSVIYSTNNPSIICKVQVLTVPSIAQAYKKQKEVLTQLNHPNVVKLYDSTQITTPNKQSFGFLLLENCSAGTAFNVLQASNGDLEQKTIIKIFMCVASVLQIMHQTGLSHRDIKLENVLRNQKGDFKICDFGSSTKDVITIINGDNRPEIEQFIEKTTTPLYRSPQQLDLYSGFQIGPKVDVFAMGCLAFMLCFKKQPFESRLSAINKQYFIPQYCPYSNQLISLIEQCFTTNPRNRPSAKQVRQKLQSLQKMKKAQLDMNLNRQLEITQNEVSRVTNKNFATLTPQSSSFFDKIKLIYSQFTTQTQGWIAGFIEDNTEAPPLKYNRFIISKCWEKRYKVQKVNEIFWQYAQYNKSKCVVTLKLLILIHNFLRKGPTEVIEYQKQYSILKLATKIYKHWKVTQKPTNSDDPKRNVFICLLIRFYSLVIIAKFRLNYQNSQLMEGNYSLVPFFQKKKQKKQVTLLKLSLIESMLHFLQISSTFHQTVQNKSYLVDIQRSIILSIVDEQYCLVSTLVFTYSAFKQAINFVDEQLDMTKIKDKIEQIDSRFESVYMKLAKLFQTAMKFSTLFQNQNFLLNPSIVKFIRDIKVGNKKQNKFQIANYINYKDNIYGLKIPLTYEEVIKNPNFLKDLTSNEDNSKNYIDVHQYKLSKNLANKEQLEYKNSPSKINPNYKNNTNSVATIEEFTMIKGKNQLKQPNSNGSNTMQFTHQNLNKDFLTNDNLNASDKFKDFLSIVDAKIQQKKIQDQQNVDKKQDLRNASMEVFQSLNNQQIKKIELMNFFDDDDDDDESLRKKQHTFDLLQKNERFNKTQQIQKPTQKIEKQIKSEKELKENQANNFIDLKGFVIEQVKKSAQQYLIDYKTLEFFQKVGNGHSSQVYRGQWRGRQVAIKRIKDNMSSPSSQKQFKRQIMTSVKIRNHPQLVTLIGVAEYNSQYFIINEFCYGLTLFDLLHESKFNIPWRIRLSIAKQIARGIIYLHTNQPPIIHRDLKSLNVLLVNKYDENSQDVQIKIADFGLSRDFASTYMTGTLGTYHWMAPEIFNNEPYSLKADVYSYGIMLWEIASRSPPYKNMLNPHSLMKFITIQNGRPDLNIIDNKCPLQIRMLMMRCWDRFPTNRPNFTEILTVLNNITIINQ